jgi:uncharacterized protein (DUF934 family)
MSKLIRNAQIVDDLAVVVPLAAGDTAESVALPGGPLIVPLAVWQARRAELSGRTDLGVWLDSAEDPAAIAADLNEFAVVALNFPKFTDGRAYSSAALLRTRYGFQGELRAIGEVLRDQLFFMQRCGFDAFALKAGKYDDAQFAAALASLNDFSVPYQGAVDQPEPLFRRAQRGAQA